MPLIPWAFVLGNLKRDLGWVWGVVTHASFWQLACGALGIWMVIVQFQLADARHDAASWEKQYNAVNKELQRISTKKDEQKVETARRIDHAKVIIRAADDRAKVIERAPLPGNCKTPSEILQADL